MAPADRWPGRSAGGAKLKQRYPSSGSALHIRRPMQQIWQLRRGDMGGGASFGSARDGPGLNRRHLGRRRQIPEMEYRKGVGSKDGTE
eukprot:6682574-Pyramimonas_sp.AAC.1